MSGARGATNACVVGVYIDADIPKFKPSSPVAARGLVAESSDSNSGVLVELSRQELSNGSAGFDVVSVAICMNLEGAFMLSSVETSETCGQSKTRNFSFSTCMTFGG